MGCLTVCVISNSRTIELRRAGSEKTGDGTSIGVSGLATAVRNGVRNGGTPGVLTGKHTG